VAVKQMQSSFSGESWNEKENSGLQRLRLK